MPPVKPKVHTAFLVDDSEVDLFIQKKFLELCSFAEEIITFSSPLKALEALQVASLNEGLNLIFLDLNMPLLNGFEFLEKINSESSGISENIKVVILSSSNSPADRLKAKEFPNVISFFSKPLNMDELQSLNRSLKPLNGK
jgi:two-component system, NarL family, nitrate/nitrite response regulator NarL